MLKETSLHELPYRNGKIRDYYLPLIVISSGAPTVRGVLFLSGLVAAKHPPPPTPSSRSSPPSTHPCPYPPPTPLLQYAVAGGREWKKKYAGPKNI